jgi:hypothetical protein
MVQAVEVWQSMFEEMRAFVDAETRYTHDDNDDVMIVFIFFIPFISLIIIIIPHRYLRAGRVPQSPTSTTHARYIELAERELPGMLEEDEDDSDRDSKSLSDFKKSLEDLL